MNAHLPFSSAQAIFVQRYFSTMSAVHGWHCLCDKFSVIFAVFSVLFLVLRLPTFCFLRNRGHCKQKLTFTRKKNKRNGTRLIKTSEN